jgi:hypothetical protein
MLGAGTLLALWAGPSSAYIDLPPATLGRLCESSMNITVLRVDKIDREKRRIIYRAMRDLKGNAPSDYHRQVFDPDDRAGDSILQWAERDKSILFFGSAGRNGGYSYIQGKWHLFAYSDGATQWWRLARVDPGMRRAYAGDEQNLLGVVSEILTGKEVVVPCVVAEDKRAKDSPEKLAHLRASLKLVDYNWQRDFVRWEK